MNHRCVACPAGLENLAGDDASQADTECDGVLCASDFYVSGHTCAPCPSGTTRLAGDDTSGGDTSCDAVLCGENEHVVDNICVSCPAGRENLAGDDASQADTDCDGILCASDFHVSGNACVACAPGTTRLAGDDASGSDTSCDAVLCAENEHVVSHACIGCPADTTNEAEDDASGPDTTCRDACEVTFGVNCEDFDEAYLKASNTGAYDLFGRSVALSGDTLAVGAFHEDSSASGVGGDQASNSAIDSGAVYVFRRNGAGVWAQEAYLKASNTSGDDRFGWSLALSGDTLVVGAFEEDSNATGIDGAQADNSASNSGAVYVFRRSSGVWAQEAYLKASNTGANDLFGRSVALSGDTLAVGAPTEDGGATGVGGDQADNSMVDSGAAYVFRRSGTGIWTQEAYIKASNTWEGDRFGNAVAVSGDTLAVGAHYEDAERGAVYVYRRSLGVWAQEAYLKASNQNPYGWFGYSVELSGDTLAVGSPLEDSHSTGIGGDGNNNAAEDSGAVYVFRHSGTGVWTQEAYIKASNTDEDDRFGTSFALYDDTLAVGAYGEASNATGIDGNQANNSAPFSGAVYLFRRNGEDLWTQEAYIKASNTDAGDYFGASVALSADTLAAGAYFESSNATGINGNQSSDSASNSGAVYVRRIAP